jgi:hypothetical protein
VSYDEVAAVAPQVITAVTSGIMPPWGAERSDDCVPSSSFKNELTLTDQERMTLSAWVDGGTPEGEPPAQPVPPPVAVALSRVDVDVGFFTPYTVSGTADQSVCFALDMQVPAGTWIKGIRVVPGNQGVVHHVNVIADPTRNSLAFRTPAGTVDCNGYPGADQKQGLTFWVPGSLPVELPDDVGIYLPDNSSLIVEVHYHPRGGVELDDTHVQLATTQVAPRWALAAGAPVNPMVIGAVLLPGPNDASGPEFLIPPGEAQHTETVELTIPAISPYTGRALPRSYIYGIGSHMHLLGKQTRVEVERPGGTECLLRENYDYRWQRFYDYDATIQALPTLDPGDTVRVRCTYDNTYDNAALAEALAMMGFPQLIPVRHGWTTLSEMCQASLVLAYEWTGLPSF